MENHENNPDAQKQCLPDYCISRYRLNRFKTRVVYVGEVGVGGDNSIRVQSMTTTPTQDVGATVKQCIELAETGCEIIRCTAQNFEAAQALKAIRQQFSQAGFEKIPLVADIHFLPKAAMEAIEHVEKVRINPGNFIDKKKFAVRTYTQEAYKEELERLYAAFTPLVLRAQALGKSLRIGTNHGSLSDRIMNQYGDTPLGMVESALEFVRIAQSHGFYDLILSFKASNPKVMIQAYRLAVSKMRAENMAYPLHLGVTEAGEGEDGRIKSAVGIGTLLADGIGDTIRVSLTESPLQEIPVAKALIQVIQTLQNHPYWAPQKDPVAPDSINPFEYQRRSVSPIQLTPKLSCSSTRPPLVFAKPYTPLADYSKLAQEVNRHNHTSKETPLEGLVFELQTEADLEKVFAIEALLSTPKPIFILEAKDKPFFSPAYLEQFSFNATTGWIFAPSFNTDASVRYLENWLNLTKNKQAFLALDLEIITLEKFKHTLEALQPANLIFTFSKLSGSFEGQHPIGAYRKLAENLRTLNLPPPPIWLRGKFDNIFNHSKASFLHRLLGHSVFAGSLLCDGLGDILSIETEPNLPSALALGYNILQGTRARMSKTEFVACPSCGRTLFDLETTTQKVKEKTGHLKGVTIAIMGCIVNGPGEMADADFGYVGGAPGKINLYVGKQCVRFNIPQEEAVERLIELIKECDKWVDPTPQINQTAHSGFINAY